MQGSEEDCSSAFPLNGKIEFTRVLWFFPSWSCWSTQSLFCYHQSLCIGSIYHSYIEELYTTSFSLSYIFLINSVQLLHSPSWFRCQGQNVYFHSKQMSFKKNVIQILILNTWQYSLLLINSLRSSKISKPLIQLTIIYCSRHLALKWFKSYCSEHTEV